MIDLPELKLTPHHQQALGFLVAAGRDAQALLKSTPGHRLLQAVVAGGRIAEHILWQANLRLVMRLALDAARHRGDDVDDLFQEGCLGLLDAIRRFDPSLGYRLSSFAHEHIKRRIWATESTSVWLSSSRYHRRLRRQLEDGDTSISSRRARVALAQQVDSDVLLNLPDPDDPFARVDDSCVELLELAEERYRPLLRMRFGFGGPVRQQEEIAAHFGVSRSTVSRWEGRALEQIREALVPPVSPGS